ncbi:glutamine-hydrolyzing carbamoyl-phosphate synthase small subunit [Nitrospirota bacterium]
MAIEKAVLVLNDGMVFEGKSFGASGEAVGEVVFNTSMCGYQEIITDPSYTGQIVTMTYTQMGNYGINTDDVESSEGPRVEAFVVKEHLPYHSNWRSTGSLSEYLKESGIIGIEGLDTRALTRHLRDHGARMGIIATGDVDSREIYARIREHPGIGGIDLASKVSTKKPYDWTTGLWGVEAPSYEKELSMVVYDFGVKFNILRCLKNAGFKVHVVPAATPAEEVLSMNPDGIMLSNGPGDPEAVTVGIENAKQLIKKGDGMTPLFGICLGHQILGLALGGSSYKLKFGHHGGNHPVMDLETGRVEITSQNHNYCIDVKGLGDSVSLTHKNLYDGTEEGMKHSSLPIMSVQPQDIPRRTRSGGRGK